MFIHLGGSFDYVFTHVWFFTLLYTCESLMFKMYTISTTNTQILVIKYNSDFLYFHVIITMLENNAIQTTIYVMHTQTYILCHFLYTCLPFIWKVYHTFHIKVIHCNIQKLKLESKHTNSWLTIYVIRKKGSFTICSMSIFVQPLQSTSLIILIYKMNKERLDSI